MDKKQIQRIEKMEANPDEARLAVDKIAEAVSGYEAIQDKILETREKLAAKGVYCEHTTAANYEAYLNYCEKYGETKDCLITMCGLKSNR